MSRIDDAIDEAIEAAQMEAYAGLTAEQLRRRLVRVEDSRRRLSNILALIVIVGYVLLFREELISLLTKLGELSHG
jgi:hypothetical protein